MNRTEAENMLDLMKHRLKEYQKTVRFLTENPAEVRNDRSCGWNSLKDFRGRSAGLGRAVTGVEVILRGQAGPDLDMKPFRELDNKLLEKEAKMTARAAGYKAGYKFGIRTGRDHLDLLFMNKLKDMNAAKTNNREKRP
jgi:hypothetical protein